MFNKDIGVYSIAMAAKPAKSGYLKAMQLMGTNKDNTVFIGDQLFTDVWGPKARILSILVQIPSIPGKRSRSSSSGG